MFGPPSSATPRSAPGPEIQTLLKEQLETTGTRIIGCGRSGIVASIDDGKSVVKYMACTTRAAEALAGAMKEKLDNKPQNCSRRDIVPVTQADIELEVKFQEALAVIHGDIVPEIKEPKYTHDGAAIKMALAGCVVARSVIRTTVNPSPTRETTARIMCALPHLAEEMRGFILRNIDPTADKAYAHRDLSANNVHVCIDDRPGPVSRHGPMMYVLDYGFCKELGDDRQSVCGTHGYIHPLLYWLHYKQWSRLEDCSVLDHNWILNDVWALTSILELLAEKVLEAMFHAYKPRQRRNDEAALRKQLYVPSLTRHQRRHQRRPCPSCSSHNDELACCVRIVRWRATYMYGLHNAGFGIVFNALAKALLLWMEGTNVIDQYLSSIVRDMQPLDRIRSFLKKGVEGPSTLEGSPFAPLLARKGYGVVAVASSKVTIMHAERPGQVEYGGSTAAASNTFRLRVNEQGGEPTETVVGMDAIAEACRVMCATVSKSNAVANAGTPCPPLPELLLVLDGITDTSVVCEIIMKVCAALTYQVVGVVVYGAPDGVVFIDRVLSSGDNVGITER